MRKILSVLLVLTVAIGVFTAVTGSSPLQVEDAQARTMIIPVQGGECFWVIYYDGITGEVYRADLHCS